MTAGAATRGATRAGPAPSPPRWPRLLTPRRTIRPTRDGWWCVLAAVGLGVAAVNTGNNLAYLLCSLLLALITVSGTLSEVAMRGLGLAAVLPPELFAGRPAVFGAAIRNRRRWLASYSLVVEVLAGAGRKTAVVRTIYLPRLDPGAERLLAWEATLPARGRQRLPGVRVATRFPFGLFVKAGRPDLAAEVLVYPALGPVSADRLRELGGSGEVAARRRGRGPDLHALRDYQAGDEPRLVHWATTARTGRLTVRDLEEETALDTRLVLETGGPPSGPALERGLSEAAGLASHLLRAGAAVEVVGPGVFVALGRGRGQERAILTALALYAPPDDPRPAGAAPAGGAPPARAEARPDPLREVRVLLG